MMTLHNRCEPMTSSLPRSLPRGECPTSLGAARHLEDAATAEALRRLSVLKSELLSTISHELRTPLTLIYGYAELLVHGADQFEPAEIAQMSSEIYAGSQTLVRLVDDLLEFARLDEGRIQLHRRSIPLAEVLNEVTQTIRAQPGGERIVTALEPDLVVHGDPERLRQIVSHLLSNALAYTADSPITVRTSRADQVIVVEVADGGPGLTDEETSRVWESLYRGARANRLPNRGSGLGLSVVKQLVELHGGTVGVRSTLGQGTTFWFTLPAACLGVKAAAAPADLVEFPHLPRQVESTSAGCDRAEARGLVREG